MHAPAAPLGSSNGRNAPMIAGVEAGLEAEVMSHDHAGEIRVFVHLAHGFGARNWNEKYRNGQIIGINEPFAYGYHRAAEDGCQVTYSEDKLERKIERLFRLAVRYFLHFDFVHAWRNRKGICTADVVWTHTESQHLAILLLFWAMRPTRRPKLIAQSVWLIDRWPKFSRLHRWLFKKLVSRADMLTLHSPENLKVARSLFPGVRCELVLYGINAEGMAPPQFKRFCDPIRLMSVGNDEDRDWTTLIQAVRRLPCCELRIASQKVPPKLLAGAKNIAVVQPKSNNELLQLYEWADVLVLALRPNLHASGITVLEEAALRGVPVICSDVGGLRAYFPGDAVKYVRPQNAEAIRSAILEMAKDDESRWGVVKRAQARMGPGGINSQSYVKRHVELSRDLLFES
ncbi:glycosyltransferase family 4 protein [Methylocella tundrae]|uniref:Glycosyl transferase n=1 Tax=Methylocella tundrae TaxID=227605 RepID=A0A4U8Z1W8_METTU|nr:glycosyltransferase family 4 protein [Methylocella tundrae]WPP03282.1 glycosyltransferase family 4 protein [Methylocella tundrae]VFU09304.1 Glycosyl transferase [Methylocella tundrae]